MLFRFSFGLLTLRFVVRPTGVAFGGRRRRRGFRRCWRRGGARGRVWTCMLGNIRNRQRRPLVVEIETCCCCCCKAVPPHQLLLLEGGEGGRSSGGARGRMGGQIAVACRMLLEQLRTDFYFCTPRLIDPYVPSHVCI